MRPSGGTGDGAVGQGDRPDAFQADHAITGAAQGRVNAQNHAVGKAAAARRCNRFREPGARRFAADPLLHLFKLLPGDAHKLILPVAEMFRKEKRRRENFRAALTAPAI